MAWEVIGHENVKKEQNKQTNKKAKKQSERKNRFSPGQQNSDFLSQSY